MFRAAQEENFINKKREWNNSPMTQKQKQNDYPIQISSILCCLGTAFFRVLSRTFCAAGGLKI